MFDIYPEGNPLQIDEVTELKSSLGSIAELYTSGFEKGEVSAQSFNSMQEFIGEFSKIHEILENAYSPQTIEYAYISVSKEMSQIDFNNLSDNDLLNFQAVLNSASFSSTQIYHHFFNLIDDIEDIAFDDDIYKEIDPHMDCLNTNLASLRNELEPLSDLFTLFNVDLNLLENRIFLKDYLKKNPEAFTDSAAKLVAIESAFYHKVQAEKASLCHQYIEKIPDFMQQIGVSPSTIEQKVNDAELLSIRFLPTFTFALESKTFGVGGQFYPNPITGSVDIKVDTNIGDTEYTFSHEYLHFLSNFNRLPVDQLIRSHWDWSVIGVAEQHVAGIDLYKGANPQKLFDASNFKAESSQYLQAANEAITELLTVMYKLFESGTIDLQQPSLNNTLETHLDTILKQEMSDYQPLVENLIRYCLSTDARVSFSELFAAYFDKNTLVELFSKDNGAAMSHFLMSFEENAYFHAPSR